MIKIFLAIEKYREAALNYPKMYIQTVLDVHKKYNTLVTSVFHNTAGFVAALDEACDHFINSAVTKMAQWSYKSSVSGSIMQLLVNMDNDTI